MSRRERTLQGRIATFLRQYARKRNPAVDPNDRHYDRGLEREIKRMKPDDLDRLMRDNADTDSLPGNWLPPWEAVSTDAAIAFERELSQELAPGHVLFDRPAQVIARRSDQDAVLVVLQAPTEFAVVHLTFSGGPERPPWPTSEKFPSASAFRQRRMVPDHHAYQGRAG